MCSSQTIQFLQLIYKLYTKDVNYLNLAVVDVTVGIGFASFLPRKNLLC
jgi:hypothetical protein